MSLRPAVLLSGFAIAMAGWLFAAPALAACSGRVQTGYGDNVLALAQRCGTTVQNLRLANPDLDLNKPLNGRIVRTPPTQPRQYIPDSIARGAPPASSVLGPIPHSHTPIIPQANREQRPDSPATGYVVRSGDTLSAIARRASVSLGRLLAANPGVEPRRLAVGQTIALPRTD